jgi:hypothetical protein
LFTWWGYFSLLNPGGCLPNTSSSNTIQEATIHIHLV